MEEKTLKTLEYDKVINMLLAYAQNDGAKEKIKKIRPARDLRTVRRMLAQTDSAYVLLCKHGAPPISRVMDVLPTIKRMEIGGTLSMSELLNVAAILKSAERMKKYYDGKSGALDDFFECLVPNKALAERISTSILSDEEMADGASSELFDIRKKISRASSKIKDVLNEMIHSPHYRKLLQDGIVTLRNDRYVVPVKAEHRGEVGGIVHDMSASGGTVFVEPSGVVNANNELRELALKEKAEIERILAELTAEAAEAADTIKYDYDGICDIEVMFAKARLAAAQKAVCPEVNDEGKILLKGARHPLLDPKKVVPQNINLGYSFDSLVVTGPNTGGKTVVLKTIGLFSLMAQSGLCIPADDGSVVAVFDGIYADIGDEQSIEQSLSTFSAHMKNIVHILDKITSKSLVLFDELGAGTDPTEGAALANAVLEYVRGLGARVAATTHYSELKIYALSTEGVENASCEFDVETLSPTYRLLIGVPGKSNAFAVSQKLGLPEHIIERSRAYLSNETVKFEDVLSNIETERKITESSRIEQERLKAEAAQLKAELKREREKIEKNREKIMKRANERAEELVESAKAETERILEEMRAAQRAKDEKEALRAMEEMRRELGVKLKKTKKAPQPRKSVTQKVNPNAFRPGQSVLIVDLNDRGTVLSIDKKAETAVVQMGIMKTTSKLSNLVVLEDETKKNIMKFIPQKSVSGGTKSAKSEVDLRGMMLEEALMEADMFLDRSVMSGLSSVTIIHGKGTGVLMNGIRDMLRKHPHVKSFRAGKYGEGENGVTVVELKNS